MRTGLPFARADVGLVSPFVLATADAVFWELQRSGYSIDTSRFPAAIEACALALGAPSVLAAELVSFLAPRLERICNEHGEWQRAALDIAVETSVRPGAVTHLETDATDMRHVTYLAEVGEIWEQSAASRGLMPLNEVRDRFPPDDERFTLYCSVSQ